MNGLRSEIQALIVILRNKIYTGRAYQTALAWGYLQTAAISLRGLPSDSQLNQLRHSRKVTNVHGRAEYSGQHKESAGQYTNYI